MISYQLLFTCFYLQLPTLDPLAHTFLRKSKCPLTHSPCLPSPAFTRLLPTFNFPPLLSASYTPSPPPPPLVFSLPLLLLSKPSIPRSAHRRRFTFLTPLSTRPRLPIWTWQPLPSTRITTTPLSPARARAGYSSYSRPRMPTNNSSPPVLSEG